MGRIFRAEDLEREEIQTNVDLELKQSDIPDLIKELQNILSQDSVDSDVCFSSTDYNVNIHFEDDSGD